MHGRRATRPRLPREVSRRYENTPPPAFNLDGRREARRSDHAGVPPVSTLLESADRPSTIPPPAPLPEARSIELQALDARERELRSDIAQLQDRAARLDRQARAIQAGFTELSGQELQSVRSRHQRRVNRPSRSSSLSPRIEARRLRATQSPPPRRSRSPPRSAFREGQVASTLPTPPHDASENHESLFLPQTSNPSNRASHPLSNSWRAESPVNGLGDRNRSPTPGDGWELMRTTITPDATLPSAESSFASAAASHSFSSHRPGLDVHAESSSSDSSRRTSADAEENRSASVSSVDPDDLVCNDEEREATAAFAQDMYFHERSYPEGMERITRHREAHANEGNRFLLNGEPECVEIGFRLINEALDNPEGRERMFQFSQSRPGQDARDFEHWIFANRPGRRRTRGAQITDDEDLAFEQHRSQAQGTLERAAAAIRRSRAQVDDYLRQRDHGSVNDSNATSDQLSAARAARAQLEDYLERYNNPDLDMLEPVGGNARVRSPPPRYEPLSSHPDVNTFTSRDEPEPHPVSPPSARSERDMADGLLSGDEQDLHAMQRIVRRLAQRDDVPDEWWMSMGLNLSRTRARSRSPRSEDGDRTRTGRIQRTGGNSRL